MAYEICCKHIQLKKQLRLKLMFFLCKPSIMPRRFEQYINEINKINNRNKLLKC